MTIRKNYPIATIWHRMTALLFDLFLINILVYLPMRTYSSQLVYLEIWSVGVSFLIPTIYFAIMNSYIGKGQTLGKRLTGIKVVNTDNSFLSLSRSFMRSGLLFLPFFLPNLYTDKVVYSPLEYLLILTFPFALIGISLYLILFNYGTRQTVHDLLCGTYVVNAKLSEKITERHIAREHYGASGLIAAAILLFSIYNYTRQPNIPDDLKKVEISIRKLPDIKSKIIDLSIEDTYFSTYSKDNRKTFILINAIKLPSLNDSELSGNIVRHVLAKYPEALKRDEIVVCFLEGYGADGFKVSLLGTISLGLSHWNTTRFRGSPKAWNYSIADMDNLPIKKSDYDGPLYISDSCVIRNYAKRKSPSNP